MVIITNYTLFQGGPLEEDPSGQSSRLNIQEYPVGKRLVPLESALEHESLDLMRILMVKSGVWGSRGGAVRLMSMLVMLVDRMRVYPRGTMTWEFAQAALDELIEAGTEPASGFLTSGSGK